MEIYWGTGCWGGGGKGRWGQGGGGGMPTIGSVHIDRAMEYTVLYKQKRARLYCMEIGGGNSKTCPYVRFQRMSLHLFF